MKTHLLLALVCLALGLPTIACDPNPSGTAVLPEPFPLSAHEPIRDVDLIFVVDTSLSMVPKQAQLRANFPRLVTRLQGIHGGLPNLHVGVITPDLGAAPFEIPGCSAEGEAGLFQKGAGGRCANPDHHYLVDVEPRGCHIEKLAVGDATTCVAHDCTQAHCERAAFDDGQPGSPEPAGLTLATDEGGCPRCRNYTGETLSEVFSCIADVGASGCGFEQPLEALHRALTTSAPHNAGFLRPHAYLAVVFITDEDDCSVENPDLFDPEGEFNSPLGPLTSFRCTEFGVTCDAPWTRVMPDGSMEYHDCVSRPSDDPLRLLHPVSRYVEQLSLLKNPQRVIAAAVAGPSDGTLMVSLDYGSQYPSLEPSCVAEDITAQPAVRLQEFVDAFHDQTPSWARTSLCQGDYTPSLEGLGHKLAAVVGTRCLASVPAGCMDPAAAFGHAPLTDLPRDVATLCAPDCTVELIDDGGVRTALSPCPPDRFDGHPPVVDPQLPVEACWHVTYNAACAVPCPGTSGADGTCHPHDNPWHYPSRGAELVVSRRASPAAGLRVSAVCSSYQLTETVCDDGLDNDADGRVDANDPDCP